MIDPLIVQAYSQAGGDLPYFVGSHQGGAGWLKSLGRIAFPILKRLFSVAQNTAEDVLVREKPILSSLGNNAMQEVTNFVSGRGISAPKKKNKTLNSFPIRRRRKRAISIPPLFARGKKRRRR